MTTNRQMEIALQKARTWSRIAIRRYNAVAQSTGRALPNMWRLALVAEEFAATHYREYLRLVRETTEVTP